MSNPTKKLMTVVFALAFAVGACGGSNGANNGSNDGGDGELPENITCEDDVCTVTEELLENFTFTPDRQWVLSGGVFVGDDENETVLTIEPGTTVYGESDSLSFLTIRRGSKIMAEGTAEEPIVFTSAKKEGQRARGDWGGLIVNGNAPLNNCTEGVCEAEGEGGTGKYGGDDPEDSSGVLRYVRVQFAGKLISPDNELNGIAFQGAGSGTTIEYVQVHMNKDDGIEFFGGTANFKYIVLTGVGDDSLDWTDGWRGKGQFLVAQQYDDNGDQGIEADNNSDDNAATPRSIPTLSNLTLLGVEGGGGSDVGILLREGTGANISNAIVQGFNEGCLDIDNEETYAHGWDGMELTGDLTLTNSIVHCEASTNFIDDDDEDFTPPFTVEEWFTTLNGGNSTGAPALEDPYDVEEPNFLPASGSSALGAGQAPSDSFFESADYIGAFGDEDWTEGWTYHVRK